MQSDVEILKQQIVGTPKDDEDTDFRNAVMVVVNSQKGSSSLLQRKLRFGYNKDARIIEELEEMGIIGPANGSKPREVYTTDAEAVLKKLGLSK